MLVWVKFSQFTAANVPVMVFAGIWLACLLYIFIDEIIEIISVIRNAESRWHRALIDDYLGFWNIVYWLSISVAPAVIAVWLSLAMETGNLQSQLGQMVEDPCATTSVDQVATFYDALGPRNNLGRREMFSIGFCVSIPCCYSCVSSSHLQLRLDLQW